jgi:hypothetical protein
LVQQWCNPPVTNLAGQLMDLMLERLSKKRKRVGQNKRNFDC